MPNDAKHEVRAVPLIALLHALAGAVDAVGYLMYGRVFVANLTGATVMLAVAILERNGHEVFGRLAVILAFVGGVLVGRLLARALGGAITQRQRVMVLSAESAVLVVFSVWMPHTHTMPWLALLGFMLGIQNTTFQRFGDVRVNTAFITGDLEKLGEAVLNPKQRNPEALVFALSWFMYGVGGLLGAVSTRSLPHHAFVLPALLAVASLALTALRPQQF